MSTDEKYSIEQVADIVHSEGLDYAITDYMSADSIQDEDLARLWRIAKEALDGIAAILPDEGDGEETDDDDSCGDCASGKCHGEDPEFCECARHSISVEASR